MKQKLTATVLGLALITPSIASADSTLYGRIHLSLDSLDNGANSETYLSSNSSRLGVRGKEDLGNGLDLLYQMEGGIDWDGGGTWGPTRNTFVALKGGWGQFTAGRFDTPFKRMVTGRHDLFGEQIGRARNITTQGPGGSSWSLRTPNSLKYSTPTVNGLGGEIALSLGETSGEDKDIWSGALSWESGPFDTALAYERHEDSTKTQKTETGWRLNAGYDFGALRIIALLQENRDDGFTKGHDRRAWGIGGAWKTGDTTFKAQYYESRPYDDAPQTGGDLIAIGADHRLSKRTTVYAVYGRTENDDNAGFVPYKEGRNARPPIAENGKTASGFGIGIVHNF